VMLEGITDRPQDIELLLAFCEGLKVEINLIPYNAAASVEGTLQRSNRVWEIAQQLRGAGYFTTIRYSGGQSIAAACGQLAAAK
jgi:23S rRNA (adenine2503-C2)-methyltransferase